MWAAVLANPASAPSPPLGKHPAAEPARDPAECRGQTRDRVSSHRKKQRGGERGQDQVSRVEATAALAPMKTTTGVSSHLGVAIASARMSAPKSPNSSASPIPRIATNTSPSAGCA